MSRWTLSLCAATIALAVASPARADYQVIRWSWGDCKIWNNDTNTMPYGEGWIVLAWGLPSYQSAWQALTVKIASGECRS
jgi:hypothetical protein